MAKPNCLRVESKARPQGLKPNTFGATNAALKGRSSTVLQTFLWSQKQTLLLVALLHEVFPGFSRGEIARGHGLFASEKFDCVPSVDVEVAEKGILPSRKWEICGGSCDADVDPYHADFDAAAVFADNCTVLGEDGSAVATGITVNQVDGFVKSFHVHHGEYGAKNL